MAIIATNSGTAQRELIPPGNYVARCYRMIQIGTIKETIQGVEKTLHKVRIGWELPCEQKVFKEELGPQPYVIDKEYTLSLNEKANLRKDLKSWRGKDFTEDEAREFDITRLIGVPCMLNIIHKPSKDGSRTYEEIAGITGIPKGVEVPPPINLVEVLSYDNFEENLFNRLPDFIKEKIVSSDEYKALHLPGHVEVAHEADDEPPF